ncbi:MAG: dodecin family protein [Bacteroidota bacterium]
MAVVKVIEIMSESSESWEDATSTGIAKASESIKNIRSAYINEQSVTVGADGKVEKYRVNLKVSFIVS